MTKQMLVSSLLHVGPRESTWFTRSTLTLL